ncbi:MAG: Ldh family oxidoreductase [Sporomusaceae bacterium]|nr:Ldh family oxidoreductase [Sporomusaceae bacterium]
MMQYCINHRDLHSFCQAVFVSLGVSEFDACITADNLIEAELRGVKSHGVARVREYADSLAQALFRPEPHIRITKETAATLAIDGDFALGAVSGTFAMQRCIAKAKEAGIAFATVKRGRHFGIAGFYAMMALPEDMIGIALCNSNPNMSVYGGTSRVLGTNPICIAVPSQERYPLVFDAATSNAAFNRIKNAALEGQAIPADWALDRNGNPTTDAKEALIGGVVPFGGYKGSGLAIMVQVLSGVLSGAFLAATKNYDGSIKDGVGFFLGAISIEAFLQKEEFKEGVDALIDSLKASRHADKVNKIYMPGELEFLRKEENLSRGLILSEAVFHDLPWVREAYKVSHALTSREVF